MTIWRVLLAPWLIADIEHVGSTSVPGLSAKPIIDLQAPVADLTDLGPMVAALKAAQLALRGSRPGSAPVAAILRRSHRGEGAVPYLHVMTLDTPRWQEQLIFRNALRANPVLVAEYAALKRALASEYADDREAYSIAKADFVESVLNRYS